MWNANTTMGEGGFMNESKSEDAGKSNVKRGQNIVPVMISHLLKANENVDVWGISAKLITFVGIVKKIEPTTTKITYEIQDETGTISACQWLEADKRNTEKTVQLNTYVEVNGLLRNQDGQNFVMILKMFPLMDLNQLTTHLLEVAWFILKAKKLSSYSASQWNASNANVKEENPSNANTNEAHGSDTMIGFDSYSGMKPEEATVLKIIQSARNIEAGIERDQIKAKVPAYLRSMVDKILDFLCEEGHIYTTESENRFKAT